MQKIVITGNLTSDPEVRATQNGVTVCTFTVAVNRRFVGQNGDRVTDFFRVHAWRQLGEVCGRCLSKSKKVAVSGELQARMFEAKNGEKRMSLDVQADEVEFLSPREPQEPDHATVQNGTVKADEGWTPIENMKLPWD